MKVNKYIFIALLLSLIFSVGAVTAQDIQENITFEQSDIDDVSIETIGTSLGDTQETYDNEKDFSLDQVEDDTIEKDLLLGQSEDNDNLGADVTGTFSDVQTKINSASSVEPYF